MPARDGTVCSGDEPECRRVSLDSARSFVRSIFFVILILKCNKGIIDREL
jgi:hypothetical protein